ncbi:hypothetical protein NDU88_002339 [Pleurodeles waltl]|uniref:Uncharacterized protein n=1 Tax=Pleurodeles waltl TaxID=8319 RepID=A0AAV7KV35_PLEWA|nr:hypothetical protein NDU88_002339 [Pleurodeles waltl]
MPWAVRGAGAAPRLCCASTSSDAPGARLRGQDGARLLLPHPDGSGNGGCVSRSRRDRRRVGSRAEYEMSQSRVSGAGDVLSQSWGPAWQGGADAGSSVTEPLAQAWLQHAKCTEPAILQVSVTTIRQGHWTNNPASRSDQDMASTLEEPTYVCLKV